MSNPTLQGQTALITGASSGLGVDFARSLARRGAGLVLVARREALLQQLREELSERYRVPVHVLPCDLGDADARERLLATLESEGLNIDVLVNNAGFGLFGDFADVEWGRTEAMLQLDIVALSHLTRALLPGMVARRRGRVLLVASVGAFQPSPGYAAYSAAKAYVLSFGHALHFELRGTGLTCTTVCPGVTATEFLTVSGQRKTWFHRATLMDSATVAEQGIRRMLAGSPEVVNGWINAVSAFFTRLTPRPLMARIAWWAMRNDPR